MATQRAKSIRSLAFLTVACIAFAATLAFPPVATADGWKYGGYNCGPYAGVKTVGACIDCCNKVSDIGPPLAPIEVARCIAFCNQAVFN